MKKNKKNYIFRFIEWFSAISLSVYSIWKLFSKRKLIKKEALNLEKTAEKKVDQLKEEVEEINDKLTKKIQRLLKDYFLPHEGNDHRPKALRPKALTIYVGVIVALKIIVTTTLFFIYPNQATLTSKIVDNLYRLTNETRIANGLEPLEINPELTLAAQRKVDDMITKGYFAHITPENKYPWQFIDSSKYPFSYMGENLAMDFSSAEVVQSAFMNSPSHRGNILNPKYKDIGIALKVGKINGKETIVLAEFFGTQKAGSSLAVATTPTSDIESNIVSKDNTDGITNKVEAPKSTILTTKTDTNTTIGNSVIKDESKELPKEILNTPVEVDDSHLAKKTELDDKQVKEESEKTDFEFNGVPLVTGKNLSNNDLSENIEKKSEAESTNIQTKKLADVRSLPSAQLVVVDQPNLRPGLVDLLVSWSRNFMTLMLIIISSLLLVNILIKTKVQHAPVIMHSLIAIFIIAAMLLVHFHTIERFVL